MTGNRFISHNFLSVASSTDQNHHCFYQCGTLESFLHFHSAKRRSHEKDLDFGGRIMRRFLLCRLWWERKQRQQHNGWEHHCQSARSTERNVGGHSPE